MIKIAVLDDESTTLLIVRNILEQNNYLVETYSNPLFFLKEYSTGMFDILISDINMPQMNGLDVVKAVRKNDKDIIIIMLSSSTDLNQIISHFKHGISDYLIKPVIAVDILHRLKTVLNEKQIKKQIETIEYEKKIIELENMKLVNWRNMYAGKDIKQTEQLILFLTKSINSEGGFMWLDLLSKIKPEIDGGVFLKSELYKLVIDSANSQRNAIEIMSYINNLPVMNIESFESSDFVEKNNLHIQDNILPMITKQNRSLSLNISNIELENHINFDLDIHLKILNELCINAIKYSPENSKIYIEIYKNVLSNSSGQSNIKSKEVIIIKVRNMPKISILKDQNNDDIIGIPYDYTGIVFDLFYTIEAFQTINENEEWTNGTGLYISRKLAHKMGGWIECKNITDYRNGNNTIYVEFTYIIPTSDSKIEKEIDTNIEFTMF